MYRIFLVLRGNITSFTFCLSFSVQLIF